MELLLEQDPDVLSGSECLPDDCVHVYGLVVLVLHRPRHPPHRPAALLVPQQGHVRQPLHLLPRPRAVDVEHPVVYVRLHPELPPLHDNQNSPQPRPALRSQCRISSSTSQDAGSTLYFFRKCLFRIQFIGFTFYPPASTRPSSSIFSSSTCSNSSPCPTTSWLCRNYSALSPTCLGMLLNLNPPSLRWKWSASQLYSSQRSAERQTSRMELPVQAKWDPNSSRACSVSSLKVKLNQTLSHVRDKSSSRKKPRSLPSMQTLSLKRSSLRPSRWLVCSRKRRASESGLERRWGMGSSGKRRARRRAQRSPRTKTSMFSTRSSYLCSIMIGGYWELAGEQPRQSNYKQMSILRSEDMQLYEVALPAHNAYMVLRRLALTEAVHLVLQPDQQARPFLPQLKAIEDGLARLRLLEEAIRARSLPVLAPESRVGRLLLEDSYDIKDVQAQLENNYQYFVHLSKNLEGIKSKLETSQETAAMLRALALIFPGGRRRAQDQGLTTMMGVCEATDQQRLSKAIFRSTRGNALYEYYKVEDLIGPNPLLASKSIVAVFIRGQLFVDRLKRLFDAYSVKQLRFPVGSSAAELEDIQSVRNQIVDAQNLLRLSEQQMQTFLAKLVGMTKDGVSKIVEIKLQLLRERKLYESLNLFREKKGFFIGFAWIPSAKVNEVLRIVGDLNRVTQGEGCYAKRIEDEQLKPPTYFKANQFLCIPQLIVQTYGVPRYKEANPAILTGVTFPFLFGVMFGDVGHGLILFAFGLALVLFSDYFRNTIFKPLLVARYFVALMGFFSVFCGLIYNDFFSLSLDLFGSCEGEGECVYPFGLDPMWNRAENYLAFVNSLKMKLSVILGVTQMVVGVFLKASNALFRGDKLDFYFQFLPQVVFICSLFAYMDFLIVYKWLEDWTHRTNLAPSIITTMINLPLKLGKTSNASGAQPMWGKLGETSQDWVQIILLGLALISVPLMLFPKPCLLTRKAPSSSHSPLVQPLHVGQSEQPLGSQQARQEHDHESGEIWVHQVIETIEYVLGCVSNTASYLRLWALSLAHSQLSEVFFAKSLAVGLEVENWLIGGLVLALLYPIFAGVTFGVLMCMDCMECFLHTLRLHWVEFQSKFYKGDGLKFSPLSLSSCLDEVLAE